MMYEYDEETLKYFIAHQGQLFSENVADSLEEAADFLQECMAVVCADIRDAREYLDEAGMDVMGMSDQELLEASEVFALPDGRFLIVEG